MAEKKIILINKWYGGISESEKVGIEGSFYASKGIDFRTQPDSITANKKLVAETEAAATNDITDLPIWIINDETAVSGDTMWAYGNTGRLYRKTSNSWTLQRAVSASNGQGLAMFNSKLYYARTSALGNVTNLDSTPPTFTDADRVLTTDVDWHPMVVFLDKLTIGNGNTVATYTTGGTFTSAALTLPTGWKVKSLAVVGDFLFIGAWRGSNIEDHEDGMLFLWDGTASTYNAFVEIKESGINALLNVQNTLYVWAGVKGNLYVFTGRDLVKVKRIAAVADGKFVDVFPGAVTNWHGIPHFGFGSDGDDTAVTRGVYTYGSVNKNYPNALNFDYPLSTGTTTGSTLQIGSVYANDPAELYVGYRDNTTYAIDLISGTAPQTTTQVDSLIMDGGEPFRKKVFLEWNLQLSANLATSESVEIQYKLDRASSWTSLGTISNSSDGAVKEKKFTSFIEGKEIQIRIILTSSTTTSPIVQSLSIVYRPRPGL